MSEMNAKTKAGREVRVPAFLRRDSKELGTAGKAKTDQSPILLILAAITGSLLLGWLLATSGTHGTNLAPCYVTLGVSGVFGAVAPYRAWRWGGGINGTLDDSWAWDRSSLFRASHGCFRVPLCRGQYLHIRVEWQDK